MNRTILAKKINLLISRKIPEKSKKSFLSKQLAIDIFGPIPTYSTRKSYHILPVNTATLSTFIILSYGGKVVMIRKKTLSQKDKYLGFIGGFINIDQDTKEQPEEGLIREFNEECCTDKKKPVIHINRNKIQLLGVYIDYTKIELDLTPTLNVAYCLRLTRREYQAFTRHKDRIIKETSYRSKVHNASNGEVWGFIIESVKNLLRREHDFSHKNEYKALRDYFNHLRRNGILL